MTSELSNIARLITGLVGSVTGLTPDDLLMETRGVTSVARARQVAMYLAHTCCSLSLAQVGEIFGRDKSTVAHAVHQIEDLRDELEFDDWLSDLEGALRAVTGLSPLTGRVLRGMWQSSAIQPARGQGSGYVRA